ncbi:uncharacterized protein [Amphiura filiformis]|uniref:uncharacterized protein n=1 Tax=Amphiura filiformis TaxID=82378 RepID=UPI003B20D3B0
MTDTQTHVYLHDFATLPLVMMGEYAVVIFVDESTVDVISSSWIEGGGRHEEGEENYCYWPTHNPAYKARKHDIPDEERWGRCKIRVIKLTKDYMKAKNCARKAEETSNLETDDEGTMQRKTPSCQT